jgi:hypothetical protein
LLGVALAWLSTLYIAAPVEARLSLPVAAGNQANAKVCMDWDMQDSSSFYQATAQFGQSQSVERFLKGRAVTEGEWNKPRRTYSHFGCYN